MPVFLIVFLLLASLVAYLSFVFLRRAAAFGADVECRRTKLVLWGCACLLGLGALVAQNFFVPFFLHFFMLAALFQLGNFILKKLARRRYAEGFGFWKKLYASCALPLLITAAALVFGYLNLHNVVATPYTVYTEKPIRVEGYRVIFISDVHYGVSVDGEELHRICAEIEKTAPDLVILGGDIIDDETSHSAVHEVFEAFASIDSRYGTFFVFGNHDRPMRGLPSEYSGQYTEKELLAVVEECGITVLRDSLYTVNGELTLAAREDQHASDRLSINALLSDADREDFLLTIDHQPTDYAQNGIAGTDLLLSGHTHGGQFFPLNLFMELFGINDAVYGVTEIDADTTAIVSSGFACWGYPFKTAAPAEYLVIDILPSID